MKPEEGRVSRGERERIEALFEEALARPPEERDAWLRAVCAEEPRVQREVRALLKAHARSGGILSAPPRFSTGWRGSPEVADPHEALHAALGDRYRLEDVLGEGGMGTVFRARDLRHGRLVAIKTIHPDFTTEAGRKRFDREIQVTAALQHPHILPLLDSGVAGRFLYYIMPCVEGESLRARLDREGRMPASTAVRIAIDVAEALEHAHRRGVIHRDIKPSNILLTRQHDALIVDFGIARVIEERRGEALTGTGRALGTPEYMAPEQLRGEATPRSDLYALGAILYEAITGLRWHGPVLPSDASWRGVPEALRPVLERALQPSPDERWLDATAFCHALEAWSAGVLTPPASAPRRLLRRIRDLLVSHHPARPSRKSVAVLPLANLSRDEETEYFSDGITEDIIAQLSKIHDLKVISRTSVMRFKGCDRPIRQIGDELGVATVLEGSVRRVQDRIRVVTQLIDVRTEDHLWAETYDRELRDIFAVQSDVARRIAEALRITISSGELSRIDRRPTDDPEAHNLYLKGRYLWNQRTKSGLTTAAEFFRRAIGRDPDYAPAYAGLADAYLLLGSYGYVPESEALGEARAAVEKALELDEDLAEAHASRGQVLRSAGEWASEEREYLRAIELNPNYATARQWYATLLMAKGRPRDARLQIRRAEELDPLSHAIGVTVGIVLELSGDHEGAIKQLRKTLELKPDYFSAYAWLLEAYCALGQYEEAMGAYRKLIEVRPEMPERDLILAYIEARFGKRDAALAILERVDPENRESVLAGSVYGLVSDPDRAFEVLERQAHAEAGRMYRLHDVLLFYAKVHPALEPLRTDPRHEQLLERIGVA